MVEGTAYDMARCWIKLEANDARIKETLAGERCWR